MTAAADLEEAARVLASGGVVLLPTDTIYGLHALATSSAAVSRIAAIKGRGDDKPFVVLASSIQQVEALGARIAADARRVLDQLWPGPLTAILSLEKPIAASRGESSIAIRVPDRDWLRTLIEKTGALASTSANRSGDEPISSPNELTNHLRSSIDFIIDEGILEGKASTIVDFTSDAPRVVREGEHFFTQKVWKTLWKSL
ncbi:MAG: threonylcarbamoyl-AMP synthase [Thermoanaerobaculia bacterium]|nr:threonylcarbamoyl-AMP synthase [Thermoanaerobaculia bacterium]